MGKHDASYIEALKKYAHKDNIKLRVVFESLKQETDRSLVVITGSLVEDSVGDLLQAHMRQPSNSRERSELWGPQGLLGSFSAKIKMAYALSLIEKSVRDRLDLFREMRNACAHSQMPIDFDTAELVAVFARFMAANPSPDIEAPYDNKRRRRAAFYVEALNLSSDLRHDAEARVKSHELAALIEK